MRCSARFWPESSGKRKTYATPPTATAIRKAVGSMPRLPGIGLYPRRRIGRVGSVERRRQPRFLAVIFGAIPKPGLADAGRTMAADETAVRVLADDVIDKEILRDDHVAFHAQHLGNVGDAARAVP